MWKPALLLVLLLALPAVFAAGDEPVLLVKREACFVHGLSAWPEPKEHVERVVAPGHALLYTVRATGQMTKLIEPTGTVAVNTRRISYEVRRVLGVTADAVRLYVLLWWSGRIYDRPPAQGATIAGGRYELRVYWLDDGTALQAPSLRHDGVPEAAGGPCLDAGPLKLVPGGVSCFRTRVRYDGRTLQ